MQLFNSIPPLIQLFLGSISQSGHGIPETDRWTKKQNKKVQKKENKIKKIKKGKKYKKKKKKRKIK